LPPQTVTEQWLGFSETNSGSTFAPLHLCAFALKLARPTADKPKGVDWSFHRRIMPAKSG
jgi:hypothetical protein